MQHTSIQLWADSLGKGVVFDEARGRYVILRDSCATLLQGALSLPLTNHSRMGATVAEGYDRFLESPAAPGGIAVIAYGGNDCDMPWAAIAEDPEGAYDGKTPIALFAELLNAFVDKARARAMTPLLVTPPPIMSGRYFQWVTRGLNADAVLRFLGDVSHIYRWQERYSIAVRRVAESAKCALFDLRDAFLADARYPELYCVDGIHPNADGQALMARTAVAELQGLSARLSAC